MAQDFTVTPYEVAGEIGYDKLIEEFGISRLDDAVLKRLEKHAGELPALLRRGVFFAHRDLNWLLDKYEAGEPFFLYTGRGPSGAVHVGHLAAWILTKWLQDTFDADLVFQFTDDEKYLFKDKSHEEVLKWTYENMLDIIAMGFDPAKTHFLVDTEDANLLYPQAVKIAKKITLSTVKASFGFDDASNVGGVFFTSMQAAPAILPSVLKKQNVPCLVPLAIDQDPHFRVARDVYPKLGFYKPAIMHGRFLPPLSGSSGKMDTTGRGESESILTTDSPKEVDRKIKKYAFSGGQPTAQEHREKGGNPDVDISFIYLKMLFEDDDEKLARIEKDYRAGSMTTGELKNYLIEKINAFLAGHQERREAARSRIEEFRFKPERFRQ